MSNISRKEFLKKSSVLGAATMILPRLTSSTLVGFGSPNEQVNIGLIGCRNQGFTILKKHLALPGVKCIAICDVDKNILDERAATLIKDYGQKPQKYSDFRKLLENKDVDAVIIGTPDHWHCLQMVYALQAGKDVYVEKPMANSIEECNIMVKAYEKYDRVVQVGQQQRSGKIWNDVMDHIKSGKIGKLRKTNVWGNFTYGVGGPPYPDSPVPEGVDFDMWLGPAPKRSFNESRFHRFWRMFWDYGGGVITDWGCHLIDMALWAKDIDRLPETVMSYGKNLSSSPNAHETFDTKSVIYPLDDYIITWDETSGLDHGPWGKNYGVAFIGDSGTIVANRNGWEVIPEIDTKTNKPKTEKIVISGGTDDHALHVKNFIKCVRSRETTVCPPQIGSVVASYAHMANITARTGEGMLLWDDKKNRFKNSSKANELISPVYRSPWELPRI